MVNADMAAYQPETSRRIALLLLAFGVAFGVFYVIGLAFLPGLPVLSAASVTIILFLISAGTQYWLRPTSQAAVWGCAALSVFLFSFLMWSLAMLYAAIMPSATGAPTYMFLFALIVLYGFYGDPKLVMFAGGVAVGARLAIDLFGIVAGGTVTASYHWATGSQYISLAGELEILLAVSVFTVLLSWLAGRWASDAESRVAQLKAEMTARPLRSGSDVTTILVAEDNAVNMMVLTNMLSDSRFSLVLTEDGQEAVSAFARMAGEGTPPDIVLLDIEMPEMDGRDAARHMRQIEKESGIDPRPIIAVTALGNEENRVASLAAGMDDHLVKPVQKPALLMSIAHALSLHRRA